MNFYRKTFQLVRLVGRAQTAKSILSRSIGITQMPMRMVHARGYNDFHDNWSFIFHEINFALSGSKNTDNFVFVF